MLNLSFLHNGQSGALQHSGRILHSLTLKERTRCSVETQPLASQLLPLHHYDGPSAGLAVTSTTVVGLCPCCEHLSHLQLRALRKANEQVAWLHQDMLSAVDTQLNGLVAAEESHHAQAPA
jgi:hypothetical protein